MDINLANVESVVHCLKKKTQRKTFDIIYIYIYIDMENLLELSYTLDPTVLRKKRPNLEVVTPWRKED